MKKIILYIFLFQYFHFLNAQSPAVTLFKNIGGSGGDYGYSIAVDALGNIYTIGNFEGTADFDPSKDTFNLTSVGPSDLFITKLDSKGNLIWAKSISGSSYIYGNSMVVDPLGNLYITGNYQETVDFDPNTGVFNLSSVGDFDIYITKLDAAGNLVWAKSIGGIYGDEARGITTNKAGEVYLTGNFNKTADFDPNEEVYNLQSDGSYDIFVTKLSAAGDLIWAKNMGGEDDATGVSIAVDKSDNVYITGQFWGTVDFDPGINTINLSSHSGYDVFIAKLDETGNLEWAKNIGGFNSSYGCSIAIDLSENVYVAGYFSYIVDFDPNSDIFNLTSFGGNDIFLMKLNDSGELVWAKSMGGSSNDEGYDMKLDASGNAYIAGDFGETADFDPNSGVYNLSTTGDYDAFVAKIDDAGNLIWAKSFGGTAAYVNSIALDEFGNAYTTGSFSGSLVFEPYKLWSNESDDVFIIKISKCNDLPSAPTVTDVIGCYGNPAHMSATGMGTLSWYDDSIGGEYLGSGAKFTSSILTKARTFYVQDSTCAASRRTAVQVNLLPTPRISFVAKTTICEGAATIVTASGASTYLWSTGETSPSIVVSPRKDSTYTVTGTATNGCSKTSSLLITVNTCTGINQSTSSAQLNLFPNPTVGELILSSSEIVDYLILTDVLGNIVAEHSPASSQFLLDMSPFDNGIYFIKIISNEKSNIYKIIKGQ